MTIENETKSEMKFYIPAPDEWDPRTRIELTFGLGDAIRYHREMTVPGIGGLTYVRQASWAVAGIDIAGKDLGAKRYRARDIANAIEALGCKLEYRYIGKENYAHIGSRAFGREPDAHLFEELRKESFYVRNTYRQTIVTALTSLEFCDTSTRFNQMKLTDKGEDLKKAFYNSKIFFLKLGMKKRKNKSCEEFLFDWVRGNRSNVFENDDFYKALSISTPTELEKQIVWNRLYTKTPKITYDKNRRIRLMDLMEKMNLDNLSEEGLCRELERMGGADHSKQISDAIRFNIMRQRAVDLLRECALLVNSLGKREVELSECLDHKPIKKAFEELKDACEEYDSKLHRKGDVPQTAVDFATSINDKPILDGIEYLISKEYGVLDIVNKRLRPLNLFDKFLNRFTNDESGENEAGEEDSADLSTNKKNNQTGFVLQRLDQWLTLWKDAHV
jgi:hypothetical protein